MSRLSWAPLLPLLMAAAASAPVTAPEAGWEVQHCGSARGTLWLTYIERGTAHITPAADTPAVRRACAAAGYAVGAASGPTRTPPHEPAVRRGDAAGAQPPATPAPVAAPAPVFSAQTIGDLLAIDARNDGGAAWRCTVNFTWTADGDPLGARPATVQATVAAHQAARVATVAGQRNVRLLAGPSAHCLPTG
jgi:hypothetical protein